MAFHINPKTGKPSVCKAAILNCPFGSYDEHFETREAAQNFYEKKMKSVTIAKAITVSPRGQKLHSKRVAPSNKFHWNDWQDGQQSVDYEYDSYHTTEEHEYCEREGICRCSVYEGLRVKDPSVDQVYSYAYRKLGINSAKESLPLEVKNALDQQMSAFTRGDNWKIGASHSYYGEEVDYITPPRELDNVLEDYYYAQPGAVDPDGVLPHLRSLGLDTTGLKPIQAVKEYLKAKGGGKPAVAAALKNGKSVELHTVKASRIAIHQPSYDEATASNAVPNDVVPKGKAVAIVHEIAPGTRRDSWRSDSTTSIGNVENVGDYGALKGFIEKRGKNRQAPVFVIRDFVDGNSRW